MKVNSTSTSAIGPQTQEQIEALKGQKTPLEESKKNKNNNYNVQLSSKGKELNQMHRKAYEMAKATDPVREDKVQALKEKIKSGEYQIDSGKIVDGMLREALKDEMALKEYL